MSAMSTSYDEGEDEEFLSTPKAQRALSLAAIHEGSE